MIRINLLAAERPTQKKRAVAAPPGATQAMVFLVIFGGAAILGCGALWFMKSSQLQDLDKQIETSRKRLSELQAIKAKVDEYEKQKRTLDAKIALIENLKAQQSGPVHLVDEISQALPDRVWLTTLDQSGAGLRIKGEANAYSSVADFITKLMQTGGPSCSEPPPPDRPPDRSACYFDGVELQTSQTQTSNVVAFDLAAQFKNAYPKIKAGPAPAAGGAAPTTKPAATGTTAPSPAPSVKP